MSETRDPDYNLVKQIQHGSDNESFEILVRKYEHRVYNFCSRFLGNDDDASDCTQEIFIRIFEKIGGFRFRSAFSTWLYRIMINSCQDMARTRKKTRHSIIESDGSGKMLIDQVIDKDRSTSPDGEILRKEINAAFQKALRSLRKTQRMVIIMRDVEGRSYEEISNLTGLRPGTVRSSLARARYRVAEELKIFRDEL